MKPQRIILVRHGESQANVDKYLFGKIPDYTIELTEKGCKQAIEAGQQLRDLVKEESLYFYVSPFWRARETFECIANAFPRTQFDYSEELDFASRNGDTSDRMKSLIKYVVNVKSMVYSIIVFLAVKRRLMCMIG